MPSRMTPETLKAQIICHSFGQSESVDTVEHIEKEMKAMVGLLKYAG